MVNNWDSFYSPLNRVHQKVMANEKGSNVRNIIQTGKSTLLPPKIPFPGSSTAYLDYSNNPLSGSNVILRSKDFNAYHQRASSENLLMEEQPSWLDDLLNEPETPVQRSHRRSSSDSFAYMDVAGGSYMDYASNLHNESRYKNAGLVQLWGSQNMDHYKDIQPGSFFADSYSAGKPRNRIWEWPLTSATRPGTLPSLRDNSIFQSAGPSSAPQKADLVPLAATEKQGNGESGLPDAKPFLEKYDGTQTKITENDTKHAKQQFAQRSRVRKLQYISELERNVQAIQAEGSEVSAELDFLNQQNLILSMENKALKQRLESLAQEQLIKHLEHEMLEREIARLRAVYQQQLQPPPLQQQNNKQLNQRQTSSTHKRANSKDLDSQFANLSLKHKDASSSTDAVHI